MNKWQPIETAPKDGTNFLGFYPSTSCDEQDWDMRRTWRGAFNEWENEAFATTDENADGPTHWQTLPEPPNE